MTRQEYLNSLPTHGNGVRPADEVAILDLLDRVAALEQRCTPGGPPSMLAEERVSVPASQPEAPGGAVPELLPCCCGAKAELQTVTDDYKEIGPVVMYTVLCSRGCEPRFHAMSRETVTDNWNRHVRSHGAGAGEAETREGSEGEPATTATSPVPAPPASHARSFARHLVQVCSNFDGVLDPRKVEEEVSGLIVRLDSSADYGEEMRGKLYAARDALEKAEADLAELRGLIRDLRAAWPGLHDDLAAMIYLKLDGQTLQKLDRTIEELAKAAGLVASAP